MAVRWRRLCTYLRPCNQHNDYTGRGFRKPGHAYIKDWLRFSALYRRLDDLFVSFVAIEGACSHDGGPELRRAREGIGPTCSRRCVYVMLVVVGTIDTRPAGMFVSSPVKRSAAPSPSLGKRTFIQSRRCSVGWRGNAHSRGGSAVEVDATVPAALSADILQDIDPTAASLSLPTSTPSEGTGTPPRPSQPLVTGAAQATWSSYLGVDWLLSGGSGGRGGTRVRNNGPRGHRIDFIGLDF